MTDGDFSEVPLENVVGIYADGENVEVFYRIDGEPWHGTVPYRGFLTTSDATAAESPKLRDIAEVEVLTGTGLKFLVRPKRGHTLAEVGEWFSAHSSEQIARSTKYDIPDLQEAFLLDSGLRYYVGMADAEIRIAYVSLIVGCESRVTFSRDFNDPGNMIVSAAVSCGDQEFVFAGDEEKLVASLDARLLQLDCDVVVGFELASRGMGHLNAAADRSKRVRDHNVALNAERYAHKRMSILDLESLCGHGESKKNRAPHNLKELAERLGYDFPGALSRRDAARLRNRPRKVQAAARYAVRLTRLIAEEHLGGALELARETPKPLDDLVHARDSEHLGAKMREIYLTQRRALPEQSAPSAAEARGGLIETPGRGRFEGVGHLDISSAYPTVIAARGLAPASDDLRAFPMIVADWLNRRQKAELAAHASEAAQDHVEALRQRAVAGRYKRLLVTAYGLTGSKYFRFADRALMGEIAATVYDTACAMRDSIEQVGGRVLATETDGCYFDCGGAEGLDHETVRKHAEAAIRSASGIQAFDLRLTGPHGAALITSRLRLLSDGTRKGWSAGNLSSFVLEVREQVVALLLAGDHTAAGELVRSSLAALERRSVAAADVAVPCVVHGPPALYITSPGFERSEMEAALNARAVDRETIRIVRSQVGERLSWTAVSSEDAEVEYDVGWAQAKLRCALAPLEPVFSVTGLPGGADRNAPPTSVVLRRASGTPHIRLIAGVKTVDAITASAFVEYGDGGAEAAFVNEHDDAHGMVLGFFGRPTQKADMASRVRIGDFRIELEDKGKGDLPLIASKACIDVLEDLGVDAEADVRVMFNGTRSIVIRVCQSAFGVENCVELPTLYRRFAKRLWQLARRALDYDGDLYDPELYNGTATYRLTGCVHKDNGFRATWLSVASLRAASTLSDLQKLPQAVSMQPFASNEHVLGLRQVFDEVNAGLARTTTHDENSRTRKSQTVARYQREEKQRKVRLRVLSEQEDPPCVETLLSRADRGDSIGFGPLSKALFELNLRGADRRVIAERLAGGAGGPERYAPRVVIKADGPDLADSLWKEDVEDSYYRNCNNDSARELCDFQRCYRSRQPRVFSDEDSPSYDEARRLAFAATATIEVPDEPSLSAIEVIPRSGKSTQLAVLAARHANVGERVLVFAQAHRALEQVGKYLVERIGQGPVFAVQLLGRGERREHCVPEQQHRIGCSGCPNNGVITIGGFPRTNPRLAQVERGHHNVVSADVGHELADGRLCARTVSRHLAESAPIVLAPTAQVTNESWAATARSSTFSVVLGDESDGLLDELSNGANKLVLAVSRQSSEGPLSEPCAMNCASCYLDFTPSPALGGWRGEQHLKNVSDHRSSETLFESLEAGLRLLDADPLLAPHIDVAALRENLSSLSRVLPRHDLVRRGHDVSPKAYNEHLSARAKGVEHAPGDGVVEEGDQVTFVPLRRCVSKDAPIAYDDHQRWRRDLLEWNAEASLPPELLGVAETADFLDHAAHVGDGVLVVPRTRPGTWATWMRGCSIELRVVDQRRVDRLREYLSARRTVLVSGTQPADELLRALFPRVEIKKLTVPLHRDVTILMHTVPNTGRTDQFLPRRFEAEQVMELVAEAGRLAKQEKRRRFAVGIFGRKRAEQQRMLELAREMTRGSEVAVLDGAQDGACPPTTGLSITIDYVRSRGSRAVDLDVDLLIIAGSGLPAFDGYHGFRHVLATAGVEVSVETLAEDSRMRAVVQAMNRSAALKGRRVVALINDLNVGDMPSWLHHRVLATDAIYRALPELAASEVTRAQVGAFAKAIMAALRPRAELPTREEILAWSKKSGPARPQTRAANERRARAMLAKGREAQVLSSSFPEGATQEWGLVLQWLSERGVLKPLGHGKGYVFTDEGLEHIGGLFDGV